LLDEAEFEAAKAKLLASPVAQPSDLAPANKLPEFRHAVHRPESKLVLVALAAKPVLSDLSPQAFVDEFADSTINIALPQRVVWVGGSID
jgi:hypothetical protein